MHNFQASLKKGQVGEELLLKAFPNLTKLDGRKSDFVSDRGDRWELKTDSYDMLATPNFFIELLSDLAREKPGGPRQAMEHGSTVWCYLFIKNSVLFTFNTAELVAWLDVHDKNYIPSRIPNKTWTTIGIKVPRIDLKHLYTETSIK
jgi:hypothetical protein